MPRYNPAVIEPKWQAYWDQNKTFRTPDMPKGEKIYILDLVPYPNSDQSDIDHSEGCTATDIVARYSRMKGKSVLHPVGYGAFGVPDEEHAIRTNSPPRVSTVDQIAKWIRPLKMMGFSYDWDRCLAMTNDECFRWTQWIFLVLYDTWFDPTQQKGRPISELSIPDDVHARGANAIAEYQDRHRLAYEVEVLVNWCPGLEKVLADEEVIDGKSVHGSHAVQLLPLRQWTLRITSYADRLLHDLDGLDWSIGIKKLQIDWIGRSTGAEVDFPIIASDQFSNWKSFRSGRPFPEAIPTNTIRVYTTRPDTLYGATYVVIAPEHPLVKEIVTSDQSSSVMAYCDAASLKNDHDRTEGQKKKTGVFTGSFAINPVTGKSIPIWVADYVLMGYGTGAIMAVPAHDDRDFAFAKMHGLPIECVVRPDSEVSNLDDVLQGLVCYTGTGKAMNSGEWNGLETDAAKAKIIDSLGRHGIAKGAVNYKLRDWLFRWHCYRRETNTLPLWAGSYWSYLRFIDPKNTHAFVDKEKEKAWMPVDLYIGGAEQDVLHLLYARFLHKVLFDRGYVSQAEPFQKLVNQGMILGEVEFTGYQRADQTWVSTKFLEMSGSGLIDATTKESVVPVKLDETSVEKVGESFVLISDKSIRVDGRAYKMSKARGNVVNLDQVVSENGADSLRLYEMFMGPLEATKPWSTSGVFGVRNFLDRVWRLVIDTHAEDNQLLPSIQDVEPTVEQNRVIHKTIMNVTHDIESFAFNTSIARMMEFVNFFTKEDVRPKQAMETLVMLLSPYAPHMAEELWQALGHDQSLAYEPWPVFDEALTKSSEVEVPLQINGKIRAKIIISADATKDQLEDAARNHERIHELLDGKQIVKAVVVPGRMVNFVVK